MLRRTMLIALSLLSLMSFILAACSAPGASDAAAGSVAPATVRFAERQAEGIHGWLAAASAPPGTGDIQVDAYLEDADGNPLEGATVTFDIDMTNMSHGKTLVKTHAAGSGHYAGKVHFSMPGPWRIIAMVEQPGQAPVPLRFEFEVHGQE